MILGLETEVFLSVVVALAFGGAVMGVLAGLFGVGGGAISVPILFELFGILGVAEEVRMPLAVGTSLAIIIPTSLRSAQGHYRKGMVDMALLRAWAVPVLVGVALGSFVARYADPWVFQVVFVFVAGVNAIKLLFGRIGWRLGEDLPRGAALYVYGAVTGLLSALMGIGGGAISNLIMTLHGRPIHQAIATSAGVGVLISIPGTVGFILAGWGQPGLPFDAVGFVSLLGLALLVPTSLMTAQLGVRLAHALSRRTMEKLFGSFLVLVCLRFLSLLLFG